MFTRCLSLTECLHVVIHKVQTYSELIHVQTVIPEARMPSGIGPNKIFLVRRALRGKHVFRHAFFPEHVLESL